VPDAKSAAETKYTVASTPPHESQAAILLEATSPKNTTSVMFVPHKITASHPPMPWIPNGKHTHTRGWIGCYGCGCGIAIRA